MERLCQVSGERNKPINKRATLKGDTSHVRKANRKTERFFIGSTFIHGRLDIFSREKNWYFDVNHQWRYPEYGISQMMAITGTIR